MDMDRLLTLIFFFIFHKLFPLPVSKVRGHLLPDATPQAGVQARADPRCRRLLALLPGHGGVAGRGPPRRAKHQVNTKPLKRGEYFESK